MFKLKITNIFSQNFKPFLNIKLFNFNMESQIVSPQTEINSSSKHSINNHVK